MISDDRYCLEHRQLPLPSAKLCPEAGEKCCQVFFVACVIDCVDAHERFEIKVSLMETARRRMVGTYSCGEASRVVARGGDGNGFVRERRCAQCTAGVVSRDNQVRYFFKQKTAYDI